MKASALIGGSIHEAKLLMVLSKRSLTHPNSFQSKIKLYLKLFFLLGIA
jgi:hypothetical protein